MIFISAWALNLNERKIYEETHNSIIDFLQVHYPNGFDTACTITVNSEPVELDDYDKELYQGDVVVLLFHPAEPVSTTAVIGFLVKLAAFTAVTFVIGQMFKPQLPTMQSSLSTRNSRGQSSSVYSLNSQQNEAKFGSVIPIIYGKIRTYPALISPPYYRYENNEEYLYQLMCIGQGKYNIDKMLISDTDTSDIQLDYFKYEKLEEADFATPSAFNSKVNDSNYRQLVKTIPDVENLELRGTPENKSMLLSFSGSDITFHPYSNGDVPDLSSLSSGSTITIAGTSVNDGTYTVQSVVNNVVTVQSHTFTTWPTGSFTNSWTPLGQPTTHALVEGVVAGDYAFYTRDSYIEYETNNALPLTKNTLVQVSGAGFNSGRQFYIVGTVKVAGGVAHTKVIPVTTMSYGITQSGSTTYTYIAKMATATFETSYGEFKYDKPHIGFEIDYVFPQGIYNSDASGNFIDRTTEFAINHKSASIVTPSGTVNISETNRDNSPIRKTYRLMYGETIPKMSISLKRITTEPSDIKSMDKVYIKSIKFIHSDPDYSTLGDITLLWCKVRASNAISSVGQFAINAWVTRTDVDNNIIEVTKDIYSNNVYGGRLPNTDLDIDFRGTYGPWQLNDMYYYVTLTVTGFYEVQYYRGSTGLVYFSQTPPPVNTPFLGLDGYHYEIDALPNTFEYNRVREFTPDKVNGAIDSQMTLFDAMRMVGKSHKYSVFPVGGQVRVKKDEPTAIRTALFNETNIIKDSFKVSYLFEEEDETDSIKVTYRDPDDFTAKTEIYPYDGIFPSEVELWGCTNQAQALSMATYLYKQDRARRKTVEFKTDIQGLIPQFLDRIAISHNIPNWGFGGQIKEINGTQLTLTCDYDRIIKDPDWDCSNTYECNTTFFPNCADGSTQIYDKILFRNTNGSVSDIIDFTIVGTGVIEISQSDMDRLQLYVGPDYDNTYFTIGSTTEMVKDYTVISVKPDTSDTVAITCANYDESIYS